MSNDLIPNSQNNLPQIFDFNGHQVRIIIINNEPWWVASDVCKVLDIVNVSQAVKRLDDDENLVYTMYISGQDRNINIINEPGLYSLINDSRKPEAKKFRRWINHEVLPSIRKTGKYESKQVQRLPSYMYENDIERLDAWMEEAKLTKQLLIENKEKTEVIKKQEDEIEFLEKEVQEKTEKAECADRFLDFEIIAFDMNEAAQTLNLELGGRNKLMEKLREDKILMKETKEVHYENGRKIIHVKNTPYSHFVQAGYFVTKTSREEKGNTTIISTKTRVTTKGLEFLRRKYN